MKTLSFNRSRISEYSRIGFLLFAFFLPLSTKFSNVFLVLSLALSVPVIFLSRSSLKNIFPLGALKYTTIGIFLLIVIRIIYTENSDDAFGHIERSISFLIVPLILFFTNRTFVLAVEIYLIKGLVAGTIVSACYLLGLNLIIYFSAQETWHIGSDLFDYYHTNKYFTEPVAIHPNYLGVYILTALLFMDNTVVRKQFRAVAIGILVLTIVFLNARSIFACALPIVFFLMFRTGFSSFRKKNFNWFLPRILLSLLLASSIYLLSETFIGYRVKNIFKVEISMKSEENFNSRNSANPRLARWKSAFNAFKQKPIFGHGTAAEKQVLQEQFHKDGLKQAAVLKYDAHNQFLGYAVRFGIIGIGLLLFFFISNLKLAMKAKRYPYALLLATIVIVCMTENYLDRNYGITYVAVFFTVFTLNSYANKERSEAQKQFEK